MSYQVLARKWRPADFHEMVGQEHVKKALVTALDANRLHHAFLFTGTRGVGKTTIARILAKCLNCQEGISSKPCGKCHTCQAIAEGRFIDLIEVDAASKTRIDDTRELLENVQYRPTEGRYKVYLIDEVHMLSGHSFNALLKTLEEPPPHVVFLLATTDPQKLPVTVLSRCLQFHLRHMTEDEIQRHLKFILEQESIEFELSALKLLAHSAEGSMRDGLSLLDQAIAHGGGAVSETSVKSMLGTIDREPIWELISAIAFAQNDRVFQLCDQFSQFGANFEAVLDEMIHAIHELALSQQIEYCKNKLSQDAQQLLNQITPDQLQLFYQIAIQSRADLVIAPSLKTGFEMTLLRMMAFQPQSTSVENKKKTETDDKSFLSQNNPQNQTTITKSDSTLIQQGKSESNEQPNGNETHISQLNPSDIQIPQTAISAISVPEAQPDHNKNPINNQHAIDPQFKLSQLNGANWPAIAEKIKAQGFTRQIVIHCQYIDSQNQEDKMIMNLNCVNFDPKMITPERIQEISDLLSSMFNHTIVVNISYQNQSSEKRVTARDVQITKQQQKMDAAEMEIRNHPLVKDVIDKFDGTIREDSIQPLDRNSGETTTYR